MAPRKRSPKKHDAGIIAILCASVAVLIAVAVALASPLGVQAADGRCTFETYVPKQASTPVVVHQPYVLSYLMSGSDTVRGIQISGGNILYSRNGPRMIYMFPPQEAGNRPISITARFEDANSGNIYTRPCTGTSPRIVTPATLPAPAIYYLDGTDERSSQRTANLATGNPAPTACAYPPSGSSETTCANRGFQTMYGVFTATAGNKAAASYFTARSSADRYDLDWSRAAQWSETVYTSETPLTVAPGTELVLQWSCQERQANRFRDESGLFGLGSKTVTHNVTLFSNAQGTNFSTNDARRGGATVTVTESTTYTVRCQTADGSHPGPALSIPVQVDGDPVQRPTASFMINGTPVTSGSTYQAIVGVPVVVTATFAADQRDFLRSSAINGPNSANEHKSVPCASVIPSSDNCWLQPDSSKTYTFTPTIGNHTFWANSLTAFFGWDHRASVTVSASCPAGAPSCDLQPDLSCPPGYTSDGGTPPVCTANDLCSNMPGNQTSVPANCVQNGSQCVPRNSSYEVRGNQCVAIGVINSFTATPTQLRKGTQTTLTWSVSNMTSCGITGSDGSTVVPAHPSQATDGSHSTKVTVNLVTRYTLRCSDGAQAKTAEQTISVLPEFQEI